MHTINIHKKKCYEAENEKKSTTIAQQQSVRVACTIKPLPSPVLLEEYRGELYDEYPT